IQFTTKASRFARQKKLATTWGKSYLAAQPLAMGFAIPKRETAGTISVLMTPTDATRIGRGFFLFVAGDIMRRLCNFAALLLDGARSIGLTGCAPFHDKTPTAGKTAARFQPAVPLRRP